MASFECLPESNWGDAEYQPRLIPARTPWKCECATLTFVNPYAICNACYNLEKPFWMGERQNTLTQIRTAMNLGCSSCSLIYEGLLEYKGLWENLNEQDLIVWLGVRPNNALYVQLEDVTARQPIGVANPPPANGIGSAVLWLEYYTLPDSPSPWTTLAAATHVQTNPLSTECKQAIQQWMFECKSKHSLCKTPTEIQPVMPPKRLLKFEGGHENDYWRLVATEQKKYRYLALSYCWGKSPMTKLTTSTKTDFEQQVPVSILPRTLQDAFRVCRWLQVKYLWIDALCIIQEGDDNDWKEEAPRMAEVYQGAYLTITATASADCDDGMVFDRVTSRKLMGAHSCGRPYTVYVRQRLGHKCVITGSGRDFPVFGRGWCYQGRLLSRRTLHFTKDELVFECAEGVRCECSRVLEHGYSRRVKAEFHRVARRGGKDSIDRVATIWHRTVRDYSAKRLTKEGDILMALSGVASRLSHLYKGQYLAGLWEARLPISLLWTSAPSCRRSTQYTAPTFSWASRIGYVIKFHKLEEHGKIDCVVNEVHCISANAAQFGSISSGFIKLMGLLCRCTFFALGTGYPPLPGDGRNARIQYGQSECKFTFDTDDDAPSPGQELYCFQVCSFPDVKYYTDAYGVRHPPWNPESEEARNAAWYSHALVLQKVNNESLAYRRIGISDQVPKTWFSKSHEGIITII